MRGYTAILAAAILLVSGCVGGTSSTDVQDPDGAGPMQPKGVDIDSEKGILTGQVLTEERLPVEGAMVQLRETEFAGTTDANGVFKIVNILPGKYTLDVGRLGYQPVARVLEIGAGQTQEMSFVLFAVEVTDEVYSQVLHYVGFFECALAAYYWVSSCTYPYTAVYLTARNNGYNLSQYGAPQDVQKNTHRFNTTITKGVGEFVAEVQWTPASVAANRMQIIILCGDYDPVWDDCLYPATLTGGSIRYGDVNGLSPIQKRIPIKTFIDMGKGKGKWDLAKTGKIWVMNYVGLPFYTEQVAFQQKFDVWNTLFYNGEGPEKYTALRMDR